MCWREAADVSGTAGISKAEVPRLGESEARNQRALIRSYLSIEGTRAVVWAERLKAYNLLAAIRSRESCAREFTSAILKPL